MNKFLKFTATIAFGAAALVSSVASNAQTAFFSTSATCANTTNSLTLAPSATGSLTFCVSMPANTTLCGAQYPIGAANAAAVGIVQVPTAASWTRIAPFTRDATLGSALTVPAGGPFPVTQTPTATDTILANSTPTSPAVVGVGGANIPLGTITLQAVASAAAGTYNFTTGTQTLDDRPGSGVNCNDIAIAPNESSVSATFTVQVTGAVSNVAPTAALAAASATLTGGTGSVGVNVVTAGSGTGSLGLACSIPASTASFAITGGANRTINAPATVGANAPAIGLSCTPQASAVNSTLTCTQTATPGPNPAALTATITCPATVAPPAPTVSISAPAGSVPDNGSTKVITVTSSAAAPAGGLSVNLTLPAVTGLYASTTCTNPIVIAAGATTATCNAVAANNTTPGDGPTNATFTVAASSASPASYTVAAAPGNAVTVNFINDDAAPPTVSISAPAGDVPDNGSSKTITVTSSAAAPAGGLSVNLLVPPVAGLYASTTCVSPIVIAAGATTATCTATAANNTTPGEGATAANFAIAASTASPASYNVAAAPGNAVLVNFVNDDTGPTANVVASAASITEGGTASFTLSCTGTGTFSVPYTINTIATDGTPAPASPVNLTCGTPLVITVATADNTVAGDSRTLTLTLGTLPSGLTAGTGAASVAVQDNDAVGPTQIPTVGALGLALMSLLIAGFGAFNQRRRQR